MSSLQIILIYHLPAFYIFLVTHVIAIRVKLSFSNSTIISSRPLQIIYSDIWTSPIISYDGFKYYVIFVDHFTIYIWFYPLKQKSQVKDIFIRFKAIVEKHLNQNIHTLYSDNGGEYIALSNFLILHGISHLTT